ncbi:hypothetical protein C2G38_2210228 [Gigaspora rosea]|uniref:Uncharacterized protein n=1 Tax=Gigaspora rosea TaxID=44941 RepID=A0A397UP96_9GLOM|nr:hypothetical protein C2G38_2210228 [Gigaspora rosea]
MKQYKEAPADLNKSLDIEPNNAFTLCFHGEAYQGLKKYKKALVDLNQSLDINPNNATAMEFRGFTYFFMKDYCKSLEDLAKSLEIEPKNAQTLTYHGATYLKMKKYNQSLKDINKSLTMEPDFTCLLNIHGETYREISKYNEYLHLYIKSSNASSQGLVLNKPKTLIKRLNKFTKIFKLFVAKVHFTNPPCDLNPTQGYRMPLKLPPTSNQNSGTLIYAPKINEHFAKILDDIKAIKSSDNLNKEGEALEPEKKITITQPD